METQALIDTGSPADYVSPAFAAWLQREGYEKVPHTECVCCPLDNNACLCSQHNFFLNITTSKDSEEKIPLSAAIMPLNSYDIIIGYPTIVKFKLLDRELFPLVAKKERVIEPLSNVTKLVQETHSNAIEHALAGALLNENLGCGLPHISDLLDGSGDDGDDLSELFNKESPWDTENKNADSPENLINSVDMHGSPSFQRKIREKIQTLFFKQRKTAASGSGSFKIRCKFKSVGGS